jgi:hypothetical protein
VLTKALILPAGVLTVGKLLLVHQLLHLGECESAVAAMIAIPAEAAAAAATEKKQQHQRHHHTDMMLGMKSMIELPPPQAVHMPG